MKGVIVQIGEAKSIVLFNNGKIRAIPTPADCHVGMVVSVELNNRLKIIAVICAAVFLVALGVFLGAALHRGERASSVHIVPHDAPPPALPSSDLPEGQGGENEHRGQIYNVTVEQAKLLPNDTKVLLTGTITESLGDEKYIFRDPTGEIMVEIERELLRHVSVSAGGSVEISGEVDIERRQLIIDVENIRKK